MLPEEFQTYTAALFGKERWERYLASFDEPVPVSIRLNPWKRSPLTPQGRRDPLTPQGGIFGSKINSMEGVPWCRNGYYLAERPNFTMDPLLHAGCYYVQEAASMFLDKVVEGLGFRDEGLGLRDESLGFRVEGLGTALDLCAAPGGKSTLLRAALPEGWQLYSNEPDRRRANILMENMQKQGHPDVIVTNNYPIDYQRAGLQFDFILCDVPCSGEGMFRKDEATIGEWSVQNVRKCAELQRSIVEDIWPCLVDGGVMVYSTCTFNLHEDEENVRWICETLGAEMIPVETRPEWNITGSLLEGWDKPVYRFIPGTTRGEGLFMAVLRKVQTNPQNPLETRNLNPLETRNLKRGTKRSGGMLRILSDGRHPVYITKEANKHRKGSLPMGDGGERDSYSHAEALLINLDRDKYPMAELSLENALKYLHHEAIVLPPETPKGFTIVTYQGHPLGFVKNIGTRANNLYPQEWKIRCNNI